LRKESVAVLKQYNKRKCYKCKKVHDIGRFYYNTNNGRYTSSCDICICVNIRRRIIELQI
jgi:hypothetical protein